MKKSDLWLPLQAGMEVVVAASSPDKLLGVREGFLRFLRDGLESEAAVVVASGRADSRSEPLPYTDAEGIDLARSKVRELRGSVGSSYHFCVAAEGGLAAAELDGDLRYFVKTWAVIDGFGSESWGMSSGVQMPGPLLEATGADLPRVVPGTRRGGGMVGSLTRGLESRRSAVAAATANALATLVYEALGADRG